MIGASEVLGELAKSFAHSAVHDHIRSSSHISSRPKKDIETFGTPVSNGKGGVSEISQLPINVSAAMLDIDPLHHFLYTK